MNKYSLKSHNKFAGLWSLIFLLTLSFSTVNSQSCDFTTGPVVLSVNGGNQTDQYNTIYILTTLDGSIIAINENAPEFIVDDEGFYAGYAINFGDGTNLSGVVTGMNVELIVGDDCFDVGPAFGFTVCEEISPCNHCLGETITLTSIGGNTNSEFTTKYVLTNNNGIIISIQNTPIFEDLDAGIYLAFAVNYESNKTIVGLEVGKNIANVQSGCLDIGVPYVIGICDQLKPNIFFDLNGCDITQTAILTIAENFDSYLWSNGSTQPFIVVPANVAANYRVTVTLSNGCIGVTEQNVTGTEIARLGDFVWEDLNADGRQNANETGMNGVTVNLFADFDKNGSPDFPNFPSCITTTRNHPQNGEPGFYEFTLYMGNYIIGVVSPSGFLPTEQNQGDEARDSDINTNGLTGSIVVEKGDVINNVDAGFRTSTSICGTVWNDKDGDGRRDLTEEGVDGVMLNLYAADGEIVATTVSLTNPASQEVGTYCFENISVRNYYIEIVLPEGRTLSAPNVGNDEVNDSDATGANGIGTTDLIPTSPGATTNNITFGIYTGGVVCGLVWQENTQGQGTENIFDEGLDSVIANSQVELLDASTEEVILIGVTGEDGRYCINSIPVGSYKVVFRASIAGTDYVQPNQGNDPLIDSDVNINTTMTAIFFVAPEETINGINAGLRLEALPIELTSFSGYWDQKKNSNMLEWQTSTEINNDYFDVERVIDNNGSFNVIGNVEGNGTSYDISKYAFEDKDIKRSGTYYYRLKQIDYDGGFEYSNIIAIDVFLNSQAALKVYPNPASEKTHVEVMVNKNDHAELTITDMMGRKIQTTTSHMLYAGPNLIDLNVKEIPNGSYLITVDIGHLKQYKLIHVAR